MKNNSVLEAEQALLGLFLATEKIDDSLSQVFILFDSSSFSNKKNQLMFDVLKDYYEKISKTKIDIILLRKIILEKKLDKELDEKYLNFLLNNAGYKSSLNEYLNTIKENDSKVKILSTLTKAKEKLNNQESSSIIEFVRNNIYEIEGRKRVSASFLNAAEVAQKYVNQVLSGDNSISGIETGFKSLDKITTGLQPGDLIIIAARPSMGKTAFALNLTSNIMFKEKKSIAFFSLEMPAEQLIQRILSSISFVDNYKFKNKNFTKDEIDRIIRSTRDLEKVNLFIDDSGSIKLDEIIWKSRKQKEIGKLDLIIIDYLQLIPTDSKGDNRQQEVSKISRSLKQLARELNVPIIALSQLSRKVEGRESKKPMLSDLRESGAIEQDADLIAFLYREEYYSRDKDDEEKSPKQITELDIAKHRNGAIGKIDFVFDTTIGKFFDTDKTSS